MIDFCLYPTISYASKYTLCFLTVYTHTHPSPRSLLARAVTQWHQKVRKSQHAGAKLQGQAAKPGSISPLGFVDVDVFGWWM